MNDKLNVTQTYPFSPSIVWKAMTDPAELSRWLMPTNFVPVPGASFQFEQPVKSELGEAGVRAVWCRVIEIDPLRKISFTWDAGEDEPPSVVAWILEPTDDGGTRVRVEHELLGQPEPHVLIEIGANWNRAMSFGLWFDLRMLDQLRKPPVPIVWVEEEPQAPSTRLAGLTNRETTPCA